MELFEKVDSLEVNTYTGKIEDYPLIFVNGVLNGLTVGQECSVSGFVDTRQIRFFTGQVDAIMTENNNAHYEVKRHEEALDVNYRRLS